MINHEASPLAPEDISESVRILLDTITNVRQKIQNEFEIHSRQKELGDDRTLSNNWIACLMTPVSTTVQFFQLLHMENAIPDKEYTEISSELNPLVVEISGLKKVYPTVDDEVPMEVREDLISRFEVIGEKIVACLKK